MTQILLQIDEPLASLLEKAAPAKTRQRSRFIRLAIQRALMDLQDAQTREAYGKQPDVALGFDAGNWSAWKPGRPRNKG